MVPPPFALDTRSLLAVAVGLSGLWCAAMWLNWRRHRTIPGLGAWTAAAGFIMVGTLGLALRGQIPGFISIVLANVAIVLGNALLWSGIRAFRFRSTGYPLILVLALACALVQTLASSVLDSLLFRAVFISLLLGSLDLLCAWELVRAGPWPTRRPGLIAAWLALCNAFSHFLRAGATLRYPEATSVFLAANSMHAEFTFCFILLQMGRMLCLLTLVSDRLQETLNQLATRDPLTRLFNRRAFLEQAELDRSRANRSGRNSVVLILDLDHFKELNDSHGHNHGDLALEGFAGILTRSLRQHDLACRWGGEEFCVLLPETEMEEALVVAERIRLRCEERASRSETFTTVSVGLALLGRDGELTDAITRADRELYRAKEQGRNQVRSGDLGDALSKAQAV